jgi:hypothetical protein
MFMQIVYVEGRGRSEDNHIFLWQHAHERAYGDVRWSGADKIKIDFGVIVGSYTTYDARRRTSMSTSSCSTL